MDLGKHTCVLSAQAGAVKAHFDNVTHAGAPDPHVYCKAKLAKARAMLMKLRDRYEDGDISWCEIDECLKELGDE